MAVSKLTSSLKEEFLNCPLCLEDFIDPVALYCLHTFCSKCLSTYAEFINTGPGQILKCPNCRTPMSLPAEGVKGLHKNYWIKNLAEKVKEISKGPSLCTLCRDEAPSVIHCLDCCSGLCDNCKDQHSRMVIFQNHRLVTYEELKEGKFHQEWKATPILCEQHRIPKDLFCKEKTCQKTLCFKCKLLDHEGHKISSMEDQAKKDINALEELAHKLDLRKKEWEDEVKSGEDAQMKIDSEVKSIIELIEVRGDYLKHCIQLEVDKLINEAKEMYLKDQDELSALLSSTKENLLRNISAVEIIKEVLEKSTYEDLIFTTPHIMKELEEVADRTRRSVNWNKWKPAKLSAEGTFDANVGVLVKDTQLEAETSVQDTGDSSQRMVLGKKSSPELSPRTTFHRSAKGPVFIDVCAADGSYITLNSSSKQPQDLGNWTISRVVDSGEPLVITIPENVTISPRSIIKIWARDACPNSPGPDDIIATDVKYFGCGEKVVTKLISKHGKEWAEHVKKTITAS